VSNEPPETAGTRGEPAAAEPKLAAPAQPGATAPVEATEPVGDGQTKLTAPTQADASEPVSLIEPEQRGRADYVGATDAPVDGSAAQSADAEPVNPEPVVEEPTDAEPVVGARPAAAYGVAEPSVQTVYVHAPVPPRRRGNRAVGSLIALVSAIVFAALYAGIALLVMPFFSNIAFLTFVGLPEFYVPVLVYLVTFVLLVLIVNRASWWAYVLGSFIVALLVYFVSIGILLLARNVFGMTPERALQEFAVTAFSPLLIAAIVAREVPIWFGAAIAARGRRQKQRNIEEKAEFETELANNRSDFGRGAIDYGTN
jgi:hypothetical protein